MRHSSPAGDRSALSIHRRALLCAGAATAAGCGPWTRRRKSADVIVAGAGLAGLFAAMELVAQGFKVLVFESSDRIGGRLWTLDDVPGRPEAGGAQVGQTYARIRYVAAKLGVDIIEDPPSAREDRLLAIGDEHVLQSAWASSSLNPFPEPHRALPPDGVLMALAGAENPFKAPADWRNPGAADRSAADYLETKGFSEAARRLADVALNANRLETYSMANVWRSLQLFAVDASIGRSGEIAGGSQRLPEAMAASLGDLVRMNSAVRSVGTDAAGVEIATAKGTHSADFCILALPFPALRNIALSPAPTGAQKAAIEALPYTQITQLHLAPQTRFWESDGWPAAMWTDGPLERVFPVKDRTDGSVVGFNAWINGWRAAEIAMKDEAALETLAQTEFARLRPASAGKLRLLKAVRWTQESYAGGAYMHWAPGQIADWADEMAAPIGRIHFAGEHLSSLHTGMEGAMEAGHRAALDIMSRAG